MIAGYLIEEIAADVFRALCLAGIVQVEASARHIHLSESDAVKLFGAGARLKPVRELSQKGEFLCEERVSIVTDRRVINNVAVLGPLRRGSQVELSLTDGVSLGIKLPVRLSGDISDTPGVLLRGPAGEVKLERGCIAAMRHLHASPSEALAMGLQNNQSVSIEVYGGRRTVFHDVPVRIKDSFRLRAHLDMDEINAAGMDGFTLGRILK